MNELLQLETSFPFLRGFPVTEMRTETKQQLLRAEIKCQKFNTSLCQWKSGSATVSVVICDHSSSVTWAEESPSLPHLIKGQSNSCIQVINVCVKRQTCSPSLLLSTSPLFLRQTHQRFPWSWRRNCSSSPAGVFNQTVCKHPGLTSKSPADPGRRSPPCPWEEPPASSRNSSKKLCHKQAGETLIFSPRCQIRSHIGVGTPRIAV